MKKKFFYKRRNQEIYKWDGRNGSIGLAKTFIQVFPCLTCYGKTKTYTFLANPIKEQESIVNCYFILFGTHEHSVANAVKIKNILFLKTQ